MTIVSSKDFAANQEKYFDLALNEQLIIQRGDNMFIVQIFPQNVKKLGARQGWAQAAKEFVESGNEETDFIEKFDDKVYQQMINSQFLKGYADSDAVYDF